MMRQAAIAAFIIYAAAIAYVSLRPMDGVSVGSWDKLAHLLMYGVFAVLAYRVTRQSPGFLYLCLGIVAYGALMEFGQSFTPGRMMSAADMLANTLGVALGALGAKSMAAMAGAHSRG